MKALVSATTTLPKAAPMTTPTAISTTFPRRMNFLNPLNMALHPPKLTAGQCKAGAARGQGGFRGTRTLSGYQTQFARDQSCSTVILNLPRSAYGSSVGNSLSAKILVA